MDDSEVFSLAGTPAPVRWRRSARARRVGLRIDPASGGVVVTLPPRAGRAQGIALLQAHAAWVAERLARLPGAVALADGAVVPVHGRPHRVRHVPGERGGAWLVQGPAEGGHGGESGDEIRVSGAAEMLPRRVEGMLRAEARRVLAASAAHKAAAAGLRPRRVVVKDTRTRWGSCTADGTLMFCWRLVMAPPEVQDYVAAHEVAHLRHMDHGPAFWALVEALSPHRRPAMRWLRAEGPGLLRVG